MEHVPVRVLAGDIGGTKTSLAVYEVDGIQLETLREARYPSARYASLDEIVREFMADGELRCDTACFGIAGPVREGKSSTTNLPWVVDSAHIASDQGFTQVWLLNDLEANAWGIDALGPDDFLVLSEGTPSPGNAAIVSAGTGLGEAGLFWDGKRHRPFASEGGHADFAPSSDIEIALLRFLQARYEGHVSWERTVSGMGLVNIYDFLCEYRETASPGWLVEAMTTGDAAAAISSAAMENRWPVCVEALELFVRLYGAEAGNHALKIMATDGVYIGGGIAPKILEKLKQPMFLEAFYDKGRMAPLLSNFPVKVILNPKTALYGPALYAAWRLGA